MQEKNVNKKHWLVLLVCCGLSVTSIGLTVNAGGVFFTPVSESLGVLRGTFAFQSTVNLLATAIISLFVPRLMDRFTFKTLLLVGTLATVAATLMMAFAKSIPFFYLLGAIRGAGAGLFGMVPLTMLVNEWFDKKHGLATSMVLGSGGIGGAVFSPLMASLIQSIGWEKAYLVLGALMLVFCLPALMIPFSVSPREEGLQPFGFAEVPEMVGKPKRRMGAGKVARSSLVLFFVFATLSSAVTGIPHHFPGFAESLNYPSTLGAMMLSAGMISNIVSKLTMGYLSDKIGVLKAIVMMIGVNTIAGIVLLVGSNPLAMLIGAFMFGSIFSVATVGITLLTREMFGIENYGTVYPVISFGGAMGGAFAMSFVGYIYDFTGSYFNAIFISLAFHVINLVLLALLVKQTKQRKLEAEMTRVD